MARAGFARPFNVFVDLVVDLDGDGDVNLAALSLAGRCTWPLPSLTGDYGYTAPMPTLIPSPTRVEAAGNKPKLIDEYVGRVNNGEQRLSVAHMRSPGGWVEPGQRPLFDEYTVVLRGTLRVESENGELLVQAGQAVQCKAGEWVRYSTPDAEGAEYIAVCLPAFSMETVRRDT